MASWYIGINRGETLNQDGVDIGTASQSTDFEFRIDTGKSSTKLDAKLALEIIINYIMSNGIPSGNIGTDLPPN